MVRAVGVRGKKGKGAAQVVAAARDILYGQFIPCPQLSRPLTSLVYTPITPPCSYTSGNLLPLISDARLRHIRKPTAFMHT